MAHSKVIVIRRGFLGIGETRRMRKAVRRMTSRGWRLADTVKGWSGVQLIFTKD